MATGKAKIVSSASHFAKYGKKYEAGKSAKDFKPITATKTNSKITPVEKSVSAKLDLSGVSDSPIKVSTVKDLGSKGDITAKFDLSELPETSYVTPVISTTKTAVYDLPESITTAEAGVNYTTYEEAQTIVGTDAAAEDEKNIAEKAIDYFGSLISGDDVGDALPDETKFTQWLSDTFGIGNIKSTISEMYDEYFGAVTDRIENLKSSIDSAINSATGGLYEKLQEQLNKMYEKVQNVAETKEKFEFWVKILTVIGVIVTIFAVFFKKGK